MDKESLKKNQFWYLFGGFGLVFLILLVCAMISGSTEAANKKSELEKLKKTVADQNAKKPKNDKFIKPWNDYRDRFAAMKDKVWATAWKAQETFYVWPETTGPDSKGQKIDLNQLMRYAADTKELELRVRENYQDVYASQFAIDKEFTLKDLVKPAIFGEEDTDYEFVMAPTMATETATGNNGPARGKSGGKRGARMKNAAASGSGSGNETSYLTVLAKEGGAPPPTPEEIWILQEDFWVKREMLDILRKVQQSASRFQRVEVKDGEAKPKDVDPNAVVRRFTNGLWEFTFYIENVSGHNVLSPKSTLKNVSPTHAVQVVAEARGTKPLEFKLVQEGFPAGVPFTVSGTPLDWNASQELPELGKLRVDSLDLLKDFKLEQKFDWSNAPIRRIDALRTAKQSHRTAICALIPNKIFAVKDDAQGSGGGTTAAPAGAPSPGGPKAAGPGGAGNLANTDTTPYGLERNRYIMATDQARHLPIAMDLVVEPAYVEEVLVAIANSPLRIQTTQVSFQKLARVLPPLEEAVEEKNPMDHPMRKDPPMRKGDPVGRAIGAKDKTSAMTGEENADTNLVELTVYGIATLYERPKPKDAAPTTPANPTPPAPMPKTTPMPGKQ